MSALSEPTMDEDNHVEYYTSTVSGKESADVNVLKATPRHKNTRSISTSGGGDLIVGSCTASTSGGNITATATAICDGNHLLQRAAAAAYNYKVINKDVDGDYLYAYHSEEDEKVYEDLCYVTFANKAEVRFSISFTHPLPMALLWLYRYLFSGPY